MALTGRELLGRMGIDAAFAPRSNGSFVANTIEGLKDAAFLSMRRLAIGKGEALDEATFDDEEIRSIVEKVLADFERSNAELVDDDFGGALSRGRDEIIAALTGRPGGIDAGPSLHAHAG
jgi:hypothetical protein